MPRRPTTATPTWADRADVLRSWRAASIRRRATLWAAAAPRRRPGGSRRASTARSDAALPGDDLGPQWLAGGASAAAAVGEPAPEAADRGRPARPRTPSPTGRPGHGRPGRARRRRGPPDPHVLAVAQRPYDPSGGPAPRSPPAAATSSGGRGPARAQHDVQRPDVGADPVGEGHEEPGAMRRGKSPAGKLPAHPLGVDVGGHDEVRRERHHRGGRPRCASTSTVPSGSGGRPRAAAVSTVCRSIAGRGYRRTADSRSGVLEWRGCAPHASLNLCGSAGSPITESPGS